MFEKAYLFFEYCFIIDSKQTSSQCVSVRFKLTNKSEKRTVRQRNVIKGEMPKTDRVCCQTRTGGQVKIFCLLLLFIPNGRKNHFPTDGLYGVMGRINISHPGTICCCGSPFLFVIFIYQWFLFQTVEDGMPLCFWTILVYKHRDRAACCLACPQVYPVFLVWFHSLHLVLRHSKLEAH